jgi:cephalosporin-C deacetylase-like acetyl esterase
MMCRSLVRGVVFASVWLAAPLLADGPPAVPPAAPAEGTRVDRYALEQYLTDIAERYWRSRQAELAALRTPADVAARADRIREDFLAAIGGLPTTDAPLNARITGVLERDGYRVEKLVYESLPGFFVTANVYVPTDRPGPFPAILGACGHAKVGKASPPYQTAFIGLVRRGYLVLAYDPPVQGERLEYRDDRGDPDRPRPLGHIVPGLQCLLTGGTVTRYFLWDGMRAIDYLLTRGDVDPRRLGAAGNSGGGTQSAFLGVVEPRLAAIAPSCYWTSWEDLWRLPESGPQDSEQVLPNFIRNRLGFADLLIAFAPKPALMLTATQDYFPVAGARNTFAEARPVYALLSAADRVAYFEHDDKHGWSRPRREATYAWFDRWFAEAGGPVTEPEDIKPEEPEALHCTTTGDVVTALGSKTVQQVNLALAEQVHAGRTLARESDAARARGLVAARVGTNLDRSVPPATLLERGSATGRPYERLALEPEPGIRLEVEVFPPPATAGRRPAVIFARQDGEAVRGVPEAAWEPWLDADHVVVAVRVRGAPVQPAKPQPFYTENYRTAMRAILLGKTMLGMRVQDLLTVYDHVQGRPDVDATRVTVVGAGCMGVVALCAVALEPKIRHAVAEQSLSSYLQILRARDYPETLVDLVVPGALEDFDLPDLAALAGPGRVTLVGPVSATGIALEPAEAAAAYGGHARVVASLADVVADLVR